MSENNGKTKLEHIPVARIIENPNALRQLNRANPEYLDLLESVKENGVFNAISVREVVDPENPDQMIYGLIDGLQRFSAAKDAGRETIPAQIMSLSDAETLEAQLMANVHKIETKKANYATALFRMIVENPLLTIKELSNKLKKSPVWLEQQLSLVKLNQKAKDLVNEEKMPLNSAYALAKLPEDEQENYLERAMTMPSGEFVPMANARVTEIRDNKKAGKATGAEEFKPTRHLLTTSELNSEIDNPVIGKALCAQLQITKPSEAFTLGLKWALSVDPITLDKRRSEFETKRKQKQEEKRAKEIEKLQAREQTNAVKQAEAAKKLAELQTAGA